MVHINYDILKIQVIRINWWMDHGVGTVYDRKISKDRQLEWKVKGKPMYITSLNNQGKRIKRCISIIKKVLRNGDKRMIIGTGGDFDLKLRIDYMFKNLNKEYTDKIIYVDKWVSGILSNYKIYRNKSTYDIDKFPGLLRFRGDDSIVEGVKEGLKVGIPIIGCVDLFKDVDPKTKISLNNMYISIGYAGEDFGKPIIIIIWMLKYLILSLEKEKKDLSLKE